jgi:hypothetical protein
LIACVIDFYALSRAYQLFSLQESLFNGCCFSRNLGQEIEELLQHAAQTANNDHDGTGPRQLRPRMPLPTHVSFSNPSNHLHLDQRPLSHSHSRSSATDLVVAKTPVSHQSDIRLLIFSFPLSNDLKPGEDPVLPGVVVEHEVRTKLLLPPVLTHLGDLFYRGTYVSASIFSPAFFSKRPCERNPKMPKYAFSVCAFPRPSQGVPAERLSSPKYSLPQVLLLLLLHQAYPSRMRALHPVSPGLHRQSCFLPRRPRLIHYRYREQLGNRPFVQQTHQKSILSFQKNEWGRHKKRMTMNLSLH